MPKLKPNKVLMMSDKRHQQNKTQTCELSNACVFISVIECKAAKGGLPNTRPEDVVLAAVSMFKFKKESILGEGNVDAFDGFVLKSNMLWLGEPERGLAEDNDERESSVAKSGDRVRP